MVKKITLLTVLLYSSVFTFIACSNGASDIVTVPKIPGAPGNVVVTAVSGTKIHISWSPVPEIADDPVTYTLLRNTIPVKTGLTVTSYDDDGLSASTSYSYVVRAVNNAGQTDSASQSCSTTAGADTQAPTKPGNLTRYNITNASCTLSWTASNDNVGVTGYNVYSNGKLFATITTTSVTIFGLSSGTTYKFMVNAFDVAGNVSAFSQEISVTTNS